MTASGTFFTRKLLLIVVWLGTSGILSNIVGVNAATDADCAPYSATDSDEFWYVKL